MVQVLVIWPCLPPIRGKRSSWITLKSAFLSGFDLIIESDLELWLAQFQGGQKGLFVDQSSEKSQFGLAML